jgi:hypothetical protein
MSAVADCYRNGWGVEQNIAKAAEWYRKAADRGISDAQYQMGRLYENGQGVTQNYAKAFSWYSRAAWAGHTDSINSLALMYARGRGIQKDNREAYVWASVGTALGDQTLSHLRDLVAVSLSQEEVRQAQEKAALRLDMIKGSAPYSD